MQAPEIVEREFEQWLDEYIAEWTAELRKHFATEKALLPVAKGGRRIAYRTEFQGLPVTIETPKGGVREWNDPLTGRSGRTEMLAPYGYIRLSSGADGEQVDCYLGPNEDAPYVYVVRQLDPDTGEYDEDKCFLGFDSEQDAREMFLAHRDDGDRAFGAITRYTVDEFKEKLDATRERPGRLKGASPAPGGQWPPDFDNPQEWYRENIRYWPHPRPADTDLCRCGQSFAQHFDADGEWAASHRFQPSNVIDAMAKAIHDYGCAMVGVPPDVAQRLDAWVEATVPIYCYKPDKEAGARHITVQYGLDGDAEQMRKVVAGFGPVRVQLAPSASIFDNPDYDVLKVDITSPDLLRLNKLVCAKVPHADLHPEYHPHLTLAYLKKGYGRQFNGRSGFDTVPFVATTLLFSDKDGKVTRISLVGGRTGRANG